MMLYKRLRANVIPPSRSSATRRVVVASTCLWMQKKNLEISKLPEQASGRPEPSCGRPEPACGRPELASGMPERASGRPESALGSPEPASGRPLLASTSPEPAFGKPEPASGRTELPGFLCDFPRIWTASRQGHRLSLSRSLCP